MTAAALDPRWDDLGRAVLATHGHQEQVDLLHQGLTDLAVPPGSECLQVSAVVARMAADPALSVQDIAADVGWSPRTLQRRFRRLVGVSPKWVLMRYRLQDATLQLEQHPDADLAEIALRFGWYDQPHLRQDFRRVLGTSPGRYVERARTPPPPR